MLRFLICFLIAFLATTTVNSMIRTNHSVSVNDTINSLLVVYHNLTHAQQKKVDNLIESSAALDAGEATNVTNEKLTDKINGFVNGLGQSVKDKINEVQDTFDQVKEDAEDKFEDVQESIVENVNELKNKTSKIVGSIHTSISNASNSVQNEFRKIKNKIEGKSGNEKTTTTTPSPKNLDPYPLAD